MKRMCRKIKLVPFLLTTSLLFFVVGTIVYGALAKRSDHVINSMNVGVLKGEIKETFEPPTKTEKNKAYKKIVTIENTENMNLFVRVMIFPQIISKDEVLLPANVGKEIKIDLQNKWIDGEDGYFYYGEKLEPGAISQEIFNTVTLSNSLSKDYHEAKLQIQVKSETVTSIGSQYRSAWWNKDITKVPTESALKTIDDKLQVAKDKD